MSESDNLPMGGTDDAHPLSLDEAANIDFYDPEEDNVEAEADQQSEEVPGEADDSQEADEIEAAEDTEGEEGQSDESEPAPEPTDDVHVTVNGQKLTLSELKAGYQRQADYSRKTTEVAEKRKALDALSARVNQTVETIADFLVKQIPAAPDPQLAMTNPAQFVQQKALHEAATAQVQALLEQAGAVKEVTEHLTAEQRRELLTQENARLAEKFPATATDEGRKKFFDTAAAAVKELGYSDAEIQSVSDHRMFALAHYAAIGMKAEQAREKAKQKVVNAPPVAPQKARSQGVTQGAARKNQEAMKRLARTGSIHDALAIDFD